MSDDVDRYEETVSVEKCQTNDLLLFCALFFCCSFLPVSAMYTISPFFCHPSFIHNIYIHSYFIDKKRVGKKTGEGRNGLCVLYTIFMLSELNPFLRHKKLCTIRKNLRWYRCILSTSKQQCRNRLSPIPLYVRWYGSLIFFLSMLWSSGSFFIVHNLQRSGERCVENAMLECLGYCVDSWWEWILLLSMMGDEASGGDDDPGICMPIKIDGDGKGRGLKKKFHFHIPRKTLKRLGREQRKRKHRSIMIRNLSIQNTPFTLHAS